MRCAKITRNPFFNYLRCFRSLAENRHLTAAESAIKGAKVWNRMTREQRRPYEEMALPYLARHRRHRRQRRESSSPEIRRRRRRSPPRQGRNFIPATVSPRRHFGAAHFNPCCPRRWIPADTLTGSVITSMSPGTRKTTVTTPGTPFTGHIKTEPWKVSGRNPCIPICTHTTRTPKSEEEQTKSPDTCTVGSFNTINGNHAILNTLSDSVAPSLASAEQSQETATTHDNCDFYSSPQEEEPTITSD